jgi:ubiquinone/menaquinone biosynthesis C-methylase UbiE
MNPNSDARFTGSIPQFYDQYMVPLLFEPYAVDLAERVASRQPGRVLEIAAGTGVVTRELCLALPPDSEIVATDLNQPMLDRAAWVGTVGAVKWQQADAMLLPFEDESFDAVVCQFGLMFFPDKPRAFAQARRVLRPGGCLIFSVWDRLEHNQFSDAVNRALEELFPDDPPRFMARVPYGYHDLKTIAQDLVKGGFSEPPEFSTLTMHSQAASARIPALALCHGTPVRAEVEARGKTLEEATEAVARVIEKRFGSGAVEGKMQAHIGVVKR